MEFARKVWSLLVGIKDALVLLFMLLFFILLYGLLAARPSPAQLREGALLLKLDGAVVEEPAVQDPISVALSGTAPLKEYRARDLVRALDAAARDEKIKAVVLDLSRFTGGGLINLQELAAAMDRVKAAKKPVLTYAMGYADDGVLLAAHASEAWLDPMGGAFVLGPGGDNLYFGRLLERFKVNYHIYRVGTFKDYVEPFVRNDQSEPSRQAREALLQGVWQVWKDDVQRARPKADIALVSTDPVGWAKASQGDFAKAAIAAGLVDRLGDRVAFGKRVAALVGEDPINDLPGGFAHNTPQTLLAAHPEAEEGKPVAVVTVAGEIVDGQAGPGTAGGDRIAGLIDQANADDMPALVLRVDSPGGSVLASEQIRAALERFRAKGRPVAISMANMAASGGYWVSTPGQRIFAQPGTLTGSIGVFLAIPSFERVLGEYGVSGDGVKTTPLSGQPDILTGFAPEVEAMFQANVENTYARFLGIVASARGREPGQIDAVAQGRVWDGASAKANGLVDEFGGLDAAIAWAAGRARLGNQWHAKFYDTEADALGDLVARFGGGEEEQARVHGGDFAALASARQEQQLDQLIGALNRLSGTRGVQAFCIDCPVLPRAQVRSSALRAGWLGKLVAVLGLAPSRI